MIRKIGKINKKRGNIALTIGKEEVKKYGLKNGDYFVFTKEEYEDLKKSTQIEMSRIDIVPDEDAVIKLQTDFKESKSREKILFEKIEELEKLNLELTSQLSRIKKESIAKRNNNNRPYESSSLLEQVNALNEKVEQLNNEIRDVDSERIKLLEDMNVFKTKRSFDIGELAKLREREEKYKNILEMLLNVNKTLLDETINRTMNATILEINSELDKTNFIQRMRGISIVREPEINKKQIAVNSYRQVESILPNDYFLEDTDDGNDDLF